MGQIIIGLFLAALGIWGLFDEWYYVLDFLKGMAPLVMIVVGMLSLALFVKIETRKLKEAHDGEM